MEEATGKMRAMGGYGKAGDACTSACRSLIVIEGAYGREK